MTDAELELGDYYGTIYSYRDELCGLQCAGGKGGIQSTRRYILYRQPAYEFYGSVGNSRAKSHHKSGGGRRLRRIAKKCGCKRKDCVFGTG